MKDWETAQRTKGSRGNVSSGTKHKIMLVIVALCAGTLFFLNIFEIEYVGNLRGRDKIQSFFSTSSRKVPDTTPNVDAAKNDAPPKTEDIASKNSNVVATSSSQPVHDTNTLPIQSGAGEATSKTDTNVSPQGDQPLPPTPSPSSLSSTSLSSSSDIFPSGVSDAMPRRENFRTATPSSPMDIDVMIFVLTRRSALGRRNTIRETWSHGHDNVAFVIGTCCRVPPKHRTPLDCEKKSQPSAAEQKTWDDTCAKEDAALESENAINSDLLFMSETDEYRHLPQKVKFAYQWGTQRTNARWFLKADDDMYVRVGSIGHYLTRERDDANLYTVLGCIKKGWGVPRTGKWAELNYKKSRYPAFPLGSCGHAVSRPVAAWISDNDESLFNYQGEDISIGIWFDESKLRSQIRWRECTRFTNNRRCKDANKYVIGHNVGDALIRDCFRHSDESVKGLSSSSSSLSFLLSPSWRSPSPGLQEKASSSKGRSIFAISNLVAMPPPPANAKTLHVSGIGRLGNQLFLYASAIGLAAKNRMKLCFHGTFLVPFFSGLRGAHCSSPQNGKEWSEGSYATFHDAAFTEDTVISRSKTNYLQSWKYFDGVASDYVFAEFSKLQSSIKESAMEYLTKHVHPEGRRVVGIHIRRGDHIKLGYLNFPGDGYFKNAVRYFTQLYGVKNVVFVVAGQDAAWCASQPIFNEDSFHIVKERHTAILDFAILAACDAVITTIGTFGWWAGWLSGGPVVYYKNHFSMSHKVNKGNVVLGDYFPPHWISFGDLPSI
eukprot:g3090.t1